MISVCIATYNGAQYIQEQLLSIIKQLGDDDEVIVSDDFSTDKTRDIVKSLGDKRIRLIDGPKSGAMKNFENALNASIGDYIFLSDQDDVWLDNKVSVTMTSLEKYDLVLSDCSVVNTKLEIIHESYFSILKPKTGVFNNIMRNHYLGCCMAFKRNVLKYALPIPDNVAIHDIWIGLCANFYGKVCIIHKPLILYRRHDNAVSYAAGVSGNSLGYKLKYRFDVFIAFIGRIISVSK